MTAEILQNLTHNEQFCVKTTYVKSAVEIFEVSNVKPKEQQDYNDFYLKFRSMACDHMKSRGDTFNFLNDQDEFLSSALEDMLILWCLEKIDVDLPNQVKLIFGDRLSENSHLKDVRKEIFEQVDELKERIQDVKFKSLQCQICIRYQLDKIKLMEHIVNDHPDPIIHVNMNHKEISDKQHPVKQEQLAQSYDHDEAEVTKQAAINDQTSIKISEFDSIDEKEEMSEYEPDDDDIRNFIDDKSDEDFTPDLFVCDQCDKPFKSKSKLQKHMKTHKTKDLFLMKKKPSVKSDPHECETCHKVFDSKEEMIRHDRAIHKKDFTCDICDEVFPNIVKFSQHINEHKTGRKRKEYVPKNPKTSKVWIKSGEDFDSADKKGRLEQKCMCDICGKELSCASSLAAHRKWHQKRCDQCELDFADRRSYLVHMRIHKPKTKVEKTATCEQCGQAFASKYNLIAHRKTHAGKMQCETCKRTFYEESIFKSHICKHYSCDICDMKFMRMKNLKMHERMHAGEVIYSCDLCEALFAKMKRLSEHRRSIHTEGGKKYKCNLCPRAFSGKSQLVKHNRTHTGEKPFKCSECDMAFNQRGNLQTHFKLHTNSFPFECVGCHQRYRSTGALKSHRESKMCGFSTEDQIGL